MRTLKRLTVRRDWRRGYMIITTKRAKNQWRLRRRRRVMVRKDGTTRERGVRAPRPLKSSRQWQLTLSPHRFQPHHMLQPQLLQMLPDLIPVIFPSATSAVSITMENARSCSAPIVIEGDTQRGTAGLTLPRTNNKETVTTTTIATTTTSPPAATMQGLATPAMGVGGLGISAETSLTTTIPEMEEQEGC